MDSLRAPMQKFAISLFKACRRQQRNGNLLYSPMIASTGLLLILLGAEGETRTEIESAMKFDDSSLFTKSTFEEDLKIAYRYTLAIIGKMKATEENILQVFRINKLFVDSDITLRQDFIEQVRKLNCNISSVNFKENPDAALSEINTFVEEGLNGKFHKSFEAGDIDKDTKMVLVNGICFKARWDVTFDPGSTTSQPFHQMNGKPINVQMMHAVLQLPYAQDQDISVTYVEIPYIGNVASLLIFLPIVKGGLKEMLKKLDAAAINKINLLKRMRKVSISLPKFQLTAKLDMKNLLSAVGMKFLIGEKANLSRMTDDKKPVFLSAATHNVFFGASEQGTDADDVVQNGPKLVNVDKVSSFSPDKVIRQTPSLDAAKCSQIPVIIDQSFLFAVRHNKTGIMMFLGRFEDFE